MKQPKPSGCFLSSSNVLSPPAGQTETSLAWPWSWSGSTTPLCLDSWSFPIPFSPEMCPSFQRRHGQFANILLLLRARRKQILQCSAQHNRHSALLSLCCIGCIFLGVALLIKGTWIWSKGHHPPCDPLPALASLGPKSHCREAKWVSWTAPGWLWGCLDSNPPASHMVYCILVQEGLRETQRQCHSWMDYPSGSIEPCVLSAAPLAPESAPWSGHFISQHL